MSQEIKVLVEAQNEQGVEGALIYRFTSPTELGKFLETAPNYLILNNYDLCWVKQVQENLKNGYSYVSNQQLEAAE